MMRGKICGGEYVPLLRRSAIGWSLFPAPFSHWSFRSGDQGAPLLRRVFLASGGCVGWGSVRFV
jgi:hypothetical protein